MNGKICLSCGQKLRLGKTCPCSLKQEVGEALEVVHNMEDGEVEEEVGEEMWDEKGGVDVLTEDYLKSLPPGWWVKEVQVGWAVW